MAGRLDKVVDYAKKGGAILGDAALAATGLHPSLHGNENASLINLAFKKNKGGGIGAAASSQAADLAKAAVNPEKSSGKLASKALGKGKSKKKAAKKEKVKKENKPVPVNMHIPEYVGTIAEFTPTPYSGGPPVRFER